MMRLMKYSAVVLFVLASLLIAQSKKPDSVTLEVMNPRSDIAPPPSFAPTPRVKELAGKKVGIYWIGKAGGDNFFDGLEQILNEKYPTVKSIRYKGSFDPGEKLAAQMAKEVDTLILGVGD